MMGVYDFIRLGHFQKDVPSPELTDGIGVSFRTPSYKTITG